MGIPTTVIIREGFTGLVANQLEFMGFPKEVPTVFELPMMIVVPGSPLTALEENIDNIIYSLTEWEPEVNEKSSLIESKVPFVGKDYEEVMTAVNLTFLKNDWGDGLPIIPPTEDRVNWILGGSDLAPDTVIGQILPRGRTATVETLAVSLAMTGGRPEYLPVLIAAVEAILEPQVNHQMWQAFEASSFPVIIVNGPIGKQIRLNSGYSCLGPHPSFPAGGNIGRALRFLLQNVGGAIPGAGAMGIYGNNRYCNAVFAEDEDGLPPGWNPLNVDLGLPSGTNTVTLHVASSALTLSSGYAFAEAQAMTTLNQWTGILRTPMYGRAHKKKQIYTGGSPGVLLMNRTTAQGLKIALNWSKEDLKNFLWKETTLTPADVARYNMAGAVKSMGLAEGNPLPLTSSPGQFKVVVAGGIEGETGFWLSTSGESYIDPTKGINLPAKWNQLLNEAKEDLGPLPPGFL